MTPDRGSQMETHVPDRIWATGRLDMGKHSSGSWNATKLSNFKIDAGEIEYAPAAALNAANAEIERLSKDRDAAVAAAYLHIAKRVWQSGDGMSINGLVNFIKGHVPADATAALEARDARIATLAAEVERLRGLVEECAIDLIAWGDYRDELIRLGFDVDYSVALGNRARAEAAEARKGEAG